jgi:hypothetical protein
MFGSKPERQRLIVTAEAQPQNSSVASFPSFLAAQSERITSSTRTNAGNFARSVAWSFVNPATVCCAFRLPAATAAPESTKQATAPARKPVADFFTLLSPLTVERSPRYVRFPPIADCRPIWGVRNEGPRNRAD